MQAHDDFVVGDDNSGQCEKRHSHNCPQTSTNPRLTRYRCRNGIQIRSVSKVLLPWIRKPSACLYGLVTRETMAHRSLKTSIFTNPSVRAFIFALRLKGNTLAVCNEHQDCRESTETNDAPKRELAENLLQSQQKKVWLH